MIKRGFDGTVETWNSVGIVKPTLICRVSCQRDTKDMVIERLMGCFDGMNEMELYLVGRSFQ